MRVRQLALKIQSYHKFAQQNFSKRVLALGAALVLLLAPSLAIAASSSSSLPFTDPNPQSGNQFGYAVSLSQDGTIAVVTSPHETDSNGNSSAGAAYVYLNSGGTWSQAPVAELAITNPLPNNDFGNAASITPDGSKIIVGAFNPQGGDSGGNGQNGAAYIYNEPAGGWDAGGGSLLPTAELQGLNSMAGDQFGFSVALSSDGNTAVVGAQFYDPNSSGARVGAAYIFSNNADVWTESSVINPSIANANSDVGASVAVSGNGSAVVVGAQSQGAANPGYAMVFSMPLGGWITTPTITSGTKITPSASDPQANSLNNLFGDSVSLTNDGSTAVIGSLGYVNGTGAAYTFSNSSGSWLQTQKLTAPDGGQLFKFGTAVNVATDGSSLLVGAPSQTGGGVTQVGEAYQYIPTGTGTWTLQKQLFPSANVAGQDFGWSVSTVNNPFYGNSFVGAPGLNSASPTANARPIRGAAASASGGTGGVYLFDTVAPTVTGYNPNYSGAGQQLTLTGGHLNPTFSSTGTSVYFGLKPAAIDSISETQITVTVPVGAVNNKIKVVTPNGTAFSGTYNVGPSITAFSPDPQGEGLVVAIKGYDLLGASATLNGVPLAVDTALTNTNTILHVFLPKDAVSGYVTVSAANGLGQNVSPTQLNVAVPLITGLSTTSTSAGKTITIKGKYLAGVTSVQFSGGVPPSSPVAATNLTVKVVVPAGATSGPVTVTAPSGLSNPSPSLTIN